ncbi:MAG: thiamine phosphate synthase [Pseudomonadota bacterium]
MTDAPYVPSRLVLVLPEPLVKTLDTALLESALGGGDIASIVVPRFGLAEADYVSVLEDVMDVTAGRETAVIAVDDTRLAGRAGVDGLMITTGSDDLTDALTKQSDTLFVGVGNVKGRDEALKFGEARPDFLFIGRIGNDIKPEPHPKNLELATWWAHLVEIPCIVMAGNEVEHIDDAAKTGAEFVALSAAVFADGRDPAACVASANEILQNYPYAQA